MHLLSLVADYHHRLNQSTMNNKDRWPKQQDGDDREVPCDVKKMQEVLPNLAICSGTKYPYITLIMHNRNGLQSVCMYLFSCQKWYLVSTLISDSFA